jgi:hypothetical protein
MNSQTIPSRPAHIARVSFGDIEIGTRFHDGKCHGMGARSHVLNWQVMEKTGKQSAIVREAHGDPRRGSEVGNGKTFHRMARVFPL